MSAIAGSQDVRLLAGRRDHRDTRTSGSRPPAVRRGHCAHPCRRTVLRRLCDRTILTSHMRPEPASVATGQSVGSFGDARFRTPWLPLAVRQRSRSSRDGGIEPEVKARDRRRMLLGGGCKPRGGDHSSRFRNTEIELKTPLGGGGRSAARGPGRASRHGRRVR